MHDVAMMVTMAGDSGIGGLGSDWRMGVDGCVLDDGDGLVCNMIDIVGFICTKFFMTSSNMGEKYS